METNRRPSALSLRCREHNILEHEMPEWLPVLLETLLQRHTATGLILIDGLTLSVTFQ